MIDVHCHLESKSYVDRDELIENLKKSGLKAIITSCAEPKDLDLTLELVEKYKGFVFATAGIHPEYVKDLSDKEIEDFILKVEQNKDKLVGIGEIGLDYYWIKDMNLRGKQIELFKKMLELANRLDKPVVIHCRDAFDDTLEILQGQKRVLLHMWGGWNQLEKVIDNNYNVSMNAILLKSKKHKKIIRDMDMGKIMLETDAPWLAPEKLLENKDTINDSRTVRKIAEKIAEVKNLTVEKVIEQTEQNSIKFFNLPL